MLFNASKQFFVGFSLF